MTLELNSAFVPECLRNKLERQLRRAWIQANVSASSFRLRWVHDDPGELIVGLELGDARVLRKPAPIPWEEETLVYILLQELEETLTSFLRENAH